MANTKISALTSGSPAQATDAVPVSRAGANRRLAASDLGAVVSTAGQGFFIGPGVLSPSMMTGAAANLSPSVNVNEVAAYMFVLPMTITVRKISFRLNATQASSHCGFGIYSGDRTTLLVDSGPIDTSTGGASKTVTLGSPVVLGPGVYWFAQTSDQVSAVQVFMLSATQATSFDYLFWMDSQPSGVPAGGLAANASVAGQLPASLGAITGATQTNVRPPAAVVFAS